MFAGAGHLAPPCGHRCTLQFFTALDEQRGVNRGRINSGPVVVELARAWVPRWGSSPPGSGGTNKEPLKRIHQSFFLHQRHKTNYNLQFEGLHLKNTFTTVNIVQL